MSASAASRARVHLVLVPGFGGFDALGQIEYYAEVTPEFRAWRAERAPTVPRAAHSVLHYFDSLPTAGVATRAAWLRSYLAKRIARCEFQAGDHVALVGHSTAGLDIRQMLLDLAREPEKCVAVDGVHPHHAVEHARILDMVRRVVFLSVPQRGTNLADWLLARTPVRRAMTRGLRAMFQAAGWEHVADVERWLTAVAIETTRADLFRAVLDALRESDEHRFHNPVARADARKAYAELGLWLRNVADDFTAIEDLACDPSLRELYCREDTGHAPPSPAAFGDAQRDQERAHWSRSGIATRSYATVGRCPFEPERVRAWNPWRLGDPHATWEVGLMPPARREKDDVVYRAVYRACAAGPFRLAGGEVAATRFHGRTRRALEAWENDGIVNTASMLWPDGEATLLVDGDHGDILGHYRLEPPEGRVAMHGASRGRMHRAYDLLASGSGFDAATFRAVWHDVFDFCVG
jgi:hypothetical protein